MKEELKLILATEKDAELIHQLKNEAFMPLYNKYHDDETSPVTEDIGRDIWRIKREGSDYYIIQLNSEKIGGVRIANCVGNYDYEEGVFYISPLFIIPKFQNRGLGFAVIQKVFEMYSHATKWRLDTILQEKANCHLYEKCGFLRVGDEKIINEFMTLIDYEKIVEE